VLIGTTRSCGVPAKRPRRDVDVVEAARRRPAGEQLGQITSTAISAARSKSACSSYSSDTAMLVMPKNAPSIAAATVPE
jgi:hypothetical protein